MEKNNQIQSMIRDLGAKIGNLEIQNSQYAATIQILNQENEELKKKISEKEGE